MLNVVNFAQVNGDNFVREFSDIHVDYRKICDILTMLTPLTAGVISTMKVR